MKDSDTISSWDELLASLETAASHPVDTAWQIYRYLQNNYTTMGSHQVRMLLVAYLKLPGVECFGYMAKNSELTIPGRHLGLTISERQEMNRIIEAAAKEIEKHVDIDKILES